MPPFGSEEYELRKHPGDTSIPRRRLEASDHRALDRQRDDGNGWEENVGAPATTNPFL